MTKVSATYENYLLQVETTYNEMEKVKYSHSIKPVIRQLKTTVINSENLFNFFKGVSNDITNQLQLPNLNVEQLFQSVQNNIGNLSRLKQLIQRLQNNINLVFGELKNQINRFIRSCQNNMRLSEIAYEYDKGRTLEAQLSNYQKDFRKKALKITGIVVASGIGFWLLYKLALIIYAFFVANWQTIKTIFIIIAVLLIIGFFSNRK